jgi:hypothetical protein
VKQRTPGERVWLALGEHFLDTETRHLLPLTALTCVEAGLGPAAVRDTWREDMLPVLGSNLLDVAGTWDGWDEDWLLSELARRRKQDPAPGIVRRMSRALALPDVAAGTLEALVKCVEDLQGTPPPEREARARALSDLARHVFEFNPPDASAWTPETLRLARSLAPGPVLALLRPALLPDEPAVAAARLEAFLRESAAWPSS